MSSRIGQWIIGQYRIVETLGRGGMGHVYLAEQPAMERLAAVKIAHTQDERWAARFRKEARAASRLNHANIVAVYNFGELVDGSLFLAMEYVDGGTVSDMMAAGPIDPPTAIEIARQCAEALRYAHALGVVHRDIKPPNIMVTRERDTTQVKLVDFGLARLHDDSSSITRPGVVIGTPRFMSPEHCKGEPSGPRADQYCLGLVLYEMLTGKPAIIASTPAAYIRLHREYEIPPPSSLRRFVCGDAIDALLGRMLKKDPAERFSDDELCAALAQLGDALASANSASTRTPRWAADELLSTPPLTPLRSVPTVPFGSTAFRRMTLLASDAQFVGGDWERVLLDTGVIAIDRALDPATRQPCVIVVGPDVERDLAELGAPTSPRDDPDAPPTLLFVRAPRDTPELSRLVRRFDNVVIGETPASGAFLRGVIRWIVRPVGGVVERFFGEVGTIQLIQADATERKASYVDSLVEDIGAQGVRRRTQRRVAHLGEEMVMSALYYAPVDEHGVPRFRGLGRDAAVQLSRDEAATLRWIVTDSWVVLSMRDPFGSLLPEDVLHRVTCGDDAAFSDGHGSIGLMMMLSMATHLTFVTCAGRYCEIVAMISRSTSNRVESRSVGVLDGREML